MDSLSFSLKLPRFASNIILGYVDSCDSYVIMYTSGVEQTESTMEDEGLPQTVQNLEDDHVREPVSTSDENSSTTNSTITVEPIPLDLVLIPPFVYRPSPKQRRKPRLLSK